MSDDAFGKHFSSSRIERAWEPPEEVVITRALAESPLLDYDDYGPLIRLLLRDPDQPTNVPDLMKEFQASGWTVGEKPLRRIMRRLKEAGHVSHEREYNPVTKRPEWVFRVFRNPANNPQYTEDGVAALSQVRPIGPNRPDRESGPVSDRAESTVSAGQTDRAESAGSAPIGPIRPDRKDDVSAGQTDRAESARSLASPPHPPEEVTTSSPNPLTDPSGRGPAAPGEEGGAVFDSGETAAAARFLQRLPQPWCVGRVKAKALAPVLLEVMSDQGWPRLAELDDRTRVLLVQQLTKNPTGVRNHGSVLERDRVPNLPLYDVVAGAGIPTQASSGVPGPPPDADPGYKPVPPPADVAAILAGLRKPSI
ncbi:hypothetical protein ACH4OX_36740 [Streptomyces roseolus]|uniref:hypothetical protein n=1 Tax=Streptomyces roseolus TaxID=67358 RepID=UPI0037943FBA